MSKVRCGKCKQYGDKNDMHKVGIQNFHKDCNPNSYIPNQSAKRAAEKDLRQKVVDDALERDGGCIAPSRGLTGRCSEVLDGHELMARSQLPGGHLILDNVVTLCRLHHSLITGDPDLGRKHGLIAERVADDNT